MTFAPERGLRAEYFASESIEARPDLSGVDPTPSTVSLQRRWLATAPRIFTARWYGFLTVESAGRYTFALTSDDGAVLEIDGRVEIDNGGRHGLQGQSVTIDLSRGAHAVALTFTQAGGAYAVDLTWAPEGQQQVPIPAWRYTVEKIAPTSVIGWHLVDRTIAILWFALPLLLAVTAWQRRQTLANHPAAASLAFFIILAIVHTWPLATDLAHLTRHDNRDSMLNEWIVGWVAHQLPRDPLHLFDANAFYPERYTLAYSEPMIVQAILAMPLLWLGAPLVLTYNLLLLSGMALSGWTMTLVVRRWTGEWPAALVAGAIYAFNAHTLSRIPHLQAQHVEFLPLALFALDRLLDVPSTRHALSLAGWFVLQGLTSVYLLVFSIFALLAATLSRITDLRRHAVPTVRAALVAGAVAAAVLTPFLLPYWWVSRDLAIVRSLGDAANFAATWSAYLTTPARVHAWWSARFADGNVLFPGALGLALTCLTIGSGVAIRDRRARMALAVAIVGFALSFGSKLPGYSVLYAAMPLLQGVRATARFGWLVCAGVAILAGFGVTVLRRRVADTHWPAVATLLIAVASFESLAAPLGLTRFEGIAPVYARVPRDGSAVVVELPFFASRSVQFNAHYMLNSTENWQPLVNGYSGFQPPSYYRNAAALEHFPDDASIAHLRTLGVTHVLVHEDQMGDAAMTALAARPDLERVDAFGDVGLYRFRR
ncbi:MAG: PA14 domain-containing protein [Vicinamibacterales bacterium]